MLKKLRVAIAVLVLAFLTFCFIDFAGIITDPLLQKIQFGPALMSLSIITLVALIVLTLLFGRIYCSVICPLGILQDVFNWLSKKFNKKKKYGYQPERKILRYGILAALIIAWICGFSVMITILEPYSAFGRIATQVLKPIYMSGNNLLALISEKTGSYLFYHNEVMIRSMASFITALLTLLIVAVISFMRGRTWCNVICPVGTILGLLSRFSLFKVRIDTGKCNHCTACGRKCKSYCLDSKNQQIDYSRCVDCFDCLDACKQKALYYGLKREPSPAPVKPAKPVAPVSKPVETAAPLENAKPVSETTTVDESRRDFLKSSLAVAIAAPQIAMAKKTGIALFQPTPASPPGSLSHKNLMQHCTGCHLCISKCPSKVLKPATMEYGLAGFMQPVMKFDQGFCNYNCTVCSDVCPAGAIKHITLEEKHQIQPGHVVFRTDVCVVHNKRTSCGACAEHCPTQAVHMVPWEDGLTHPEINTELCLGCGGCEYICPVHAIYVEGNPEHLVATLPKQEETTVSDDFGFGF